MLLTAYIVVLRSCNIYFCLHSKSRNCDSFLVARWGLTNTLRRYARLCKACFCEIKVLPLIPNVGCLGHRYGLQYGTLTGRFCKTKLKIEKVICYESIFHDESINVNHVLPIYVFFIY